MFAFDANSRQDPKKPMKRAALKESIIVFFNKGSLLTKSREEELWLRLLSLSRKKD